MPGESGKLSRERDRFEMEYPCHSPEGKRWFIGRVTPHRLGENKSSEGKGEAAFKRGAVVAHENITERKKAEMARRKAEKKYYTMINNYFEMIYLHDVEGNIIEVNEAVLQKMGYSQEAILDMTVFDLHPGDTGIYRRDLIIEQWKSWQPGQRELLEREHCCRDGTTFPVEISTGKIEITGKHYILAFVRDISERLEREENIKHMSFHDDLIDLYNRSFMEEEIKRLNSQRQLPLSVMMSDSLLESRQDKLYLS